MTNPMVLERSEVPLAADPANATALLSIRDLSIEFRSPSGIVKAVNGISIDIPKRATVALVGESGSGKSVTAQAILGLLPKTGQITGGSMLFRDGEVEIDLASLDRRSAQFQAIRGRAISMVFQEPMTAFSPLHTIGDQIAEAVLVHRSISRAEARDLSIETLRLVRFPNPDQAIASYPFELSGGLRQRAMIAMALMCRPALLIADEPTTALDVTLQAQILGLLRDLQSELGMSVLLITHDLGVVANIAESVAVMHHGKIVESGSTRDLFANPRHPYLVSLMKAVPELDEAEPRRLKPIREVKIAVEAIGESRKPVSKANEEPILRAEGLWKRFSKRGGGWFNSGSSGTVDALRDVSFAVHRGECLGIVGESGSGKTTLARALMRSVVVDRGAILLTREDGDHLDLVTADRDALFPVRKRLQYVFQDPYSALDPRMTVGDIVCEPLEIHGVGTRRERRERARQLLSAVGLEADHTVRYPHSFSGGQRQRIGIARALALDPEIMICDEPVAALDVSVQAQILNLLKDMQRLRGLTYLFISHNLAVVNYIADRVMVMCDGAVVEIAPRRALLHNPVHPYTKSLIAAVPHADLERPLDLAGLPEAGDPGQRGWEEPFAFEGGAMPPLVEIAPDHLVRMSHGQGSVPQTPRER